MNDDQRHNLLFEQLCLIPDEAQFVEQLRASHLPIHKWSLSILNHVVRQDWTIAVQSTLGQFDTEVRYQKRKYADIGTVLHLARSERMIDVLIESVPNTAYDTSYFHYMIEHIDFQNFSSQLVDHFLNFFDKDCQKRSLLVQATEKGAQHIVRMLLPMVNEYGVLMAMLRAAQFGRMDMAEILYTPEAGEQFMKIRHNNEGIFQIDAMAAHRVNVYITERVMADRAHAAIVQAVEHIDGLSSKPPRKM